ncbi:integral membrane sensor signal transduction histidine kinase [Pusillimonas sp. T7-7]|uniref:sensor histidine kinase n=1 Tax=Pusillimonas sp. (strain T7-7) TaxID=1007105 RepID=UPI00020848F1|nr:sensor histidine kinase [Pusillimonas sp. T7-7]AEC21057.1 integral membrane sensor signal transduction histidine kinase [Pusillimonas sp. T7-7]
MNPSISRPSGKAWSLLLQAITVLILGLAAMRCQAGPILVPAEQDWPIALPHHDIRVFEDRDAAMSLEDVATLDQHQFQPLDTVQIPTPSRSAWWLRFDVENIGQKPLDLRLVLSDAVSIRGRIDYYQQHNTQWHHIAMGAEVPVSPHTAHSARRQALPFNLSPHERTTVIVRVTSVSRLAINPWLYDREAYMAAELHSALWDGILIGGLLFLAWGALLIALMSRSLNFGLLALLCIVVTLYEAAQRGYAKVFLWPQASDWALRGPAFLGFASMALVLTFVLAIAQREGIRIPGRRLIVVVIAFQAMTALAGLFGGPYWAAQLAPFAMGLYGASVLVCAVILLKASVPSSRAMIIAGVFIASHTLLRLLEQTGWLSQFVAGLGIGSMATNPVLAIARLALNMGVLVAWTTIVAKQRTDANNELMRMREQESERLKEQVAIQTEALNRSLLYANEENRRKTETLSYVGHDLRAPLATIVGYARMLQAGSTPEQKNHIEAIERSANYQMSLIDEIVDYARHEQPTPLNITLEAIALKELLDNIMQHAQALARHQSNRLELHAETPLPTMVKTDHKRLQQVLLNLISNAAKFTRNGYIQLTVGVQHTQAQTELVFQVKDSGAGIELKQHDSIFNAYTQLDARPGSAGLGLHIAQRIIQNMNGTITLDSRPGEGSRFRLSIPVEFLTDDTIRIDEIIAIVRPEDKTPSLSSPQHIPPVELRVDLAKYAREGQLSSIENWLNQQTTAHPGCAPFFSLVQQALKTLDFDRIETLALANTK